MDIKDFWKMARSWFMQKNPAQKVIWIIFLGIFVYEFFVTPTRYELFGFVVISLPVVLILDYLFTILKRK